MGLLGKLFSSANDFLPADELAVLHEQIFESANEKGYTTSFAEIEDFDGCTGIRPARDWRAFRRAFESGRLQIRMIPGGVMKMTKAWNLTKEGFVNLVTTDEILFCKYYWYNTIYVVDSETRIFYVCKSFLDDPRFSGTEEDEMERIRAFEKIWDLL